MNHTDNTTHIRIVWLIDTGGLSLVFLVSVVRGKKPTIFWNLIFSGKLFLDLNTETFELIIIFRE